MPLPRRPRRTFAPAALTVAGTLVLAACTQPAAGEPDPTATPPETPAIVSGSVWVANEDGDSLSVLDAQTGKVVTTVEGVEAPHNVQVGPGGDSVWAVSGHASALVRLDPATYKLAAEAATGASPAHVVVAPDGKRVFVTNSGDDTLGVYDATTTKLQGEVDLGDGPHGMRPAGDTGGVVVANTTAGTVDIVDSAGQVSATIPVGASPVQVAVTPDATTAYVTLGGDSAVARVDLAGRKVTGRVEVPSAPAQLYLSDDGTRLLSADQGSEAAPGNTVSVIDPRTMTVTASIETGRGPHGLVVDPSGRRAWVTNMFEDTVSALDLTTNKVLNTVPVGDKPNGVSYAARPAADGPATVKIAVTDFAEGQDGAASAEHDADNHDH